VTRPVSTTLRAAADRIDALPADVPDPSVEVVRNRIHVRWNNADAGTARAVVAALPGAWNPFEDFMYLTDVVDPGVMWWINFATVEPVAVVDARALLAEVAHV
jgi:hypothetical protein